MLLSLTTTAPSTPHSQPGDRSVAGPVAWNSLPASIRELTSTNSFKRQLKTFISSRIRTCCLTVSMF